MGGIKEKLLAARRSGIQNIIFPGSNKKDYDELNGSVFCPLPIQFDVLSAAFAHLVTFALLKWQPGFLHAFPSQDGNIMQAFYLLSILTVLFIQSPCMSAEEVKSGVQAYFVEQYKDVFDLALDYDPAKVSDVKTGTEATL